MPFLSKKKKLEMEIPAMGKLFFWESRETLLKNSGRLCVSLKDHYFQFSKS